MAKQENLFMEGVKNVFGYVYQILSNGIFPQIANSAERIMGNIDDRIVKIEERFLSKTLNLLIIGLGCIMLNFALFFYLKEFLGWNNTVSFFSIGIIILVIGLILKIGESGRYKSGK